MARVDPITPAGFPGTSPGRHGADPLVFPPTHQDALRALRPDQASKDRVRALWDACTDRHRDFVLRVLRSMQSHLPYTHPLSPSSGSTAGLQVLDALIDGIESRHDPTALEHGWLHLGKAHAATGLTALDYRPLGHAVFHSAHEVFADSWSTELSSSWVAYYLWVSCWVTYGSWSADTTDVSRTAPHGLRGLLSETGRPDRSEQALTAEAYSATDRRCVRPPALP